MRITAISGGVGGARFLRGLLHALVRDGHQPDVTVIGNTGDDITLFGLRVCPDLDTVLYTLGGGIHEAQGWGRADETYSVQGELRAYGATPQWFGMGDKDFATHIVRSQWLGQGQTLSQVTARLADRWGLPAQGVRLLPMTDSPVETHVVVDEGDGPRAIHFQQWWVKDQAATPAERFVVAGLDQAVAAPGVLDAIRQADLIVLPPSNPVVSIGIVLSVPGVRDALRGTAAPIVGVSPLVAGRPVRGHADACLSAIGVETTARAVAGLYADFLSGWLVDEAEELSRYDDLPGVRVLPRPLLMSDIDATADIARATLDLGSSLIPA